MKENKNDMTGYDGDNSNDPGNQDPNNMNNHSQPEKGPGLFSTLMTIMFLTLILNIFVSAFSGKNKVETTYNQFIELVESGNVEQVQIDESEIKYLLDTEANEKEIDDILLGEEAVKEELFKSGDADLREHIYATGPINDPDLKDLLFEKDVKFSQKIIEKPSIWSVMLSWILPFLIMYLFYYFIMRNTRRRLGQMGQGGNAGGMFGGDSTIKEYNIDGDVQTVFDDVAGQDEAKESLAEMIDFIKDPGKYRRIGAKQPKGALLVGPPGTGKTLLARAMAGEAGVPFYYITGSEFVEMFVGVGAKRVRDLFEEANKNAPSIIFIDEIDAIGKSRADQASSNDEREQTLNQLLAEMDGFDPSQGTIVLAATNRPEVLDQALLRPGRFDRQIQVELPDLPGREAILEVHCKKIKMADDINLREIALATNGASGADLANMTNEAALRSVKMGREEVIQEDLMESVEVVIAGKEKKDRVMNPKERELVAYHEVGHALVSALQSESKPVHKITIVPRTKGSLGYTMSISEEERYLLTREELLAEINTLMGGRAAEIVEFDVATTGASNDIERATKLARSMVTMYGMSDRFGPMGMESPESQYLDGRNISNISEETSTKVDKEVQLIIQESQDYAINLLEENRDALTNISEYLLEKETITGEEFMELLDETIENRE